MAIAVPTLSSAGWVRSQAEKADFLISHFYESDKAQTYLYTNNVSNLQWIIEQYGSDITMVTQQLRIALETYLSRFYDTANVDVTSEDIEEDGMTTGKIKLRVYCVVTEDGKQYSFGRLIMATDAKINEVIKLNNLEGGRPA